MRKNGGFCVDKKKNITISDIAAAAAVSKATVSRYLNGNYGPMSAETRERIARVIEMSGYQPNSFARSLKGHSSRLIGLVVADISSPFTSSMIRGVTHVLYDNGYTPLIADCRDSPEVESSVLDTMKSHNADGLIVNTSSFDNKKLIQMECAGMPVVLCDRYVKDYRFSFVGISHRQPILDAIAHLKEQGFGLVAYFNQPYDQNSARMSRRKAFYDGMKVHYPQLEPAELEFLIDVSDRSRTEAAVRRVLEYGKGRGIPAIIACNTTTLLHVVSTLIQLKVSIPWEVGICGPDDWGFSQSISWTSLISPSLTTFHVNSYQLGCMAAELMLKKIGDPDIPKKDQIIPSVLDISESTLLKR